MAQILDTVLVCPLLASLPSIIGQISAFGEDEQPHGIESIVAREWAAMAGAQLLQTVMEAFLIRGPLAGEEDEAVEHHACAEHWDVFD